jgi:hypothetical protein
MDRWIICIALPLPDLTKRTLPEVEADDTCKNCLIVRAPNYVDIGDKRSGFRDGAILHKFNDSVHDEKIIRKHRSDGSV